MKNSVLVLRPTGQNKKGRKVLFCDVHEAVQLRMLVEWAGVFYLYTLVNIFSFFSLFLLVARLAEMKKNMEEN